MSKCLIKVLPPLPLVLNESYIEATIVLLDGIYTMSPANIPGVWNKEVYTAVVPLISISHICCAPDGFPGPV
tara:strand:- start:671 stop:886 length:216 start_codon:yes stop_codon:yes gene_type:complete